MTHRTLTLLLLVVCSGCVQTAAAPETTNAGPSMADTSPAPKHLMSEFVRNDYTQLIASLEFEPTSDETWELAAEHAAQLTEAGSILLRDPAATDEAWLTAATFLHDGGTATQTAIANRDLEAARRYCGMVNLSCSGCHRECSAGYNLPWQD